MSRPCKPIQHGDKEFPSLKAMAKHYGVGSSAISGKIQQGHWHGEKLHYTDNGFCQRDWRVHLAETQFKWLQENRPQGASADEFAASIITNAMINETHERIR